MAELATWTDVAQASAAIVVTAFTAVLTWVGVVQMKLLKRANLQSASAVEIALKSAQAAERTADISEKALRSLERPFLVVEVLNSGIEHREREIRWGSTKYRFRNHGRTPAVLSRQHFRLDHTAEGPEPMDPTSALGRLVPHGFVIGAGEASQEFETGNALPIISAIEASQEGRHPKGERILLVGFVRYRDLMGSEYATGFCFLHTEQGFTVASPRIPQGESDPYNYDRQLT